jgi:hypothetical protein
MSTETAAKDNDIASMLDSIEEAIGADMSWSDVPPVPPAVAGEEGEVEVIQVIEIDDAPVPVLTMNAPASEEPYAAPEEPYVAPEIPPFQGISSELSTYPDPTPRPAGIGGFVRGSTRDIIGLFKWGGA